MAVSLIITGTNLLFKTCEWQYPSMIKPNNVSMYIAQAFIELAYINMLWQIDLVLCVRAQNQICKSWSENFSDYVQHHRETEKSEYW